jgi:phospholipase/lecithinase/hemolysin
MKFLSTLFFLIFSSLAFSSSLNTIVVFGDSLSDNGNLYQYMQHKIPPSPPYFAGHFTNGHTWVEDLAASYFPKNSKAHLLDFAYGGAAVVEGGPEDDAGVLFTLKQEIDSYLLGHHGKADEHSLFVVWIGSNNYLSLSEDTDAKEIETILAQVNSGITRSLQRLADAGAKSILVLNLPDLGLTPYARAINLQQRMSYITKQHNKLLQKSINQLKGNNPTVRWLHFDIKSVLNEAIVSPQTYGFTNVTETCYESVANEPSPTATLRMAANIKHTSPKNHCDGYLFFDLLHPTKLAHRLMAERARSFLDAAGIELIDEKATG